MATGAVIIEKQLLAAFGHGGNICPRQPPGRRRVQPARRRRVRSGRPAYHVIAGNHPIDRAGVIVGDIDCPVGALGDIDRAPGDVAVTVEAGEEVPLLYAVVRPVQRDDLVAVGNAAVPGAVQSDQRRAFVAGGPAAVFDKGHAQRRVVGAKIMGRGGRLARPGQRVGAHVGIGHVVAVEIGPAVITAGLDAIQLAGGEVVTQQVAPVVRRVQFAAPGRPVKTDAVAQPGGEDLTTAAVEPEAHHGGAPLILFHADIAGRALGEV